MFIPRQVKYRKQHKLSQWGIASRKTSVSFGSYGLKAMSASWVTSRQIEAARRSITHFLKRGGKLWIRIFPDKSVTTKGSEVPMGGGKGAPDYYVAIVKIGMMLFEIDGVDRSTAKEALRLAGHKLPVRTKFVSKDL